MTQYVIELAHDPSECVAALDEIDTTAEDMLGDIYWSCMSGNHVGRVVVEANSEEQAREMVPPSIRNEVTVTKADLITPDLVNALDPEAKNPLTQEPDAS